MIPRKYNGASNLLPAIAGIINNATPKHMDINISRQFWICSGVVRNTGICFIPSSMIASAAIPQIIFFFFNFANHNLNGSAFGEGTDWIILKIVSLFAQSVLYFFPSLDNNFSCRHFVDNSDNSSSRNTFLQKSKKQKKKFSIIKI